MGTMREELVASMLREFNLAAMTAQFRREADLAIRADQPPVWRWSPGTFVFPEGLCCYCGGVMLSPCIWRVEGQQFHGSWKVVDVAGGRGHFVFSDAHPHSNHGSICMGAGDYRAGSVADALFLAFNPTSMYFGGDDERGLGPTDQLKQWFADRFNHTCGFKLEVRTIEGVDLAHVIAPEEGCHCGHCRKHRGEIQCPLEGCGEWYTSRVGHGKYSCTTCGRRGMRFCVEHTHQQKICNNCGDGCDLWDVGTGALFDPPPITQCEACKVWICNYCMSMDAGISRHGCVRGKVVEVAEEVDENTCHHECCRVCCVDNGCDLVEAGWDSDGDEDEDDGEDEPFAEEVFDDEEV